MNKKIFQVKLKLMQNKTHYKLVACVIIPSEDKWIFESSERAPINLSLHRPMTFSSISGSERT